MLRFLDIPVLFIGARESSGEECSFWSEILLVECLALPFPKHDFGNVEKGKIFCLLFF